MKTLEEKFKELTPTEKYDHLDIIKMKIYSLLEEMKLVVGNKGGTDPNPSMFTLEFGDIEVTYTNYGCDKGWSQNKDLDTALEATWQSSSYNC